MKRRGTPIAPTNPAGKDHPQFRTVLCVRTAAHCTALQSQQPFAVGLVLWSYLCDLVRLETHSCQRRRFDRERLCRPVLVPRIRIIGEHLALLYLVYRCARQTVEEEQQSLLGP